MRHSLVNILKNILRPPREAVFRGDFGTWDEARRASGGYDDSVILEKVKNALLRVKQGEAVYERDSVLFDKPQYPWPLLASLLWIATKNGNRLDILDFGGSLGTTYFQIRKFLSHLDEMRWNIIEQPEFVRCGRERFQDSTLRFYISIEECLTEKRPDVFILSSVLPYLETPHDVLDELIRHRPRYLILDRTPILDHGDDRLTVQTVPPEIYRASYPAWFFNRERLLAHFAGEYDTVAEFDAMSGVFKIDNEVARDKGFIFALKH